MIIEQAAWQYLRKLAVVVAVGFTVASLCIGVAYHLLATPDEGIYLINARKHGVLDGDMFEKNIENVIEPLSHADVVFLGNSRMGFALNRGVAKDFFEKHKLKYFMLAFGHAEGVKFPLHILEKYNIHPALVVANIDETFFGKPFTFYAEDVINRTYAETYTRILWARSWVSLQNALHHILYNFKIKRSKVVYPCMFRYRDDGTWRRFAYFENSWVNDPYHDGSKLIAYENSCGTIAPEVFDEAKSFDLLMRGNGSRVVTITVPTPALCTGNSLHIAQSIGRPYINIAPDSLSSYDTEHLDDDSARLFTSKLLDELSKTEEFKAVVAAKARLAARSPDRAQP